MFYYFAPSTTCWWIQIFYVYINLKFSGKVRYAHLYKRYLGNFSSLFSSYCLLLVGRLLSNGRGCMPTYADPPVAGIACWDNPISSGHSLPSFPCIVGEFAMLRSCISGDTKALSKAYIQKAREFADSAFQAKRFCGKSAQILTTKSCDKSA